jgi:8-oxo-dGTP diphosphatase
MLPTIVHRAVLGVYRRLPVRGRRFIVRTLSPSFTVGAMCFIERDDGAVLLVQHSYRDRWGVPGGLLQRGESKEAGAIRETFEETGLRIELVGEPTVVVDAPAQRIDVVFRGKPIAGVDIEAIAPQSPEITAAKWFAAGDLPELQFETAGALVALARSSTSPTSRPLPDLRWPDLG